MYAHCLLLAALIFSAFPPGAAPESDVTIVERLRSEFRSVLGNKAGAAEDAIRPAGHFDFYLTRAGGARAAYAESSGEVDSATLAMEKPDGLPGPRPTYRRGSSCWWLWLLFGIDVCW
jgi:hypothetical protein